jgi:hypothetical protein
MMGFGMGHFGQGGFHAGSSQYKAALTPKTNSSSEPSNDIGNALAEGFAKGAVAGAALFRPRREHVPGF